ncbi:MAG: glycosyltransferase [Candidatus Subteraquimicrobiales bacterium]|nr:glycosyltransferase [Candidatus Subteraquimicrobiales bacterium]
MAGKRFLFFLAGLELGGAERQALHLVRHLKSLGCDVRVWGNSGPGLAADQCDEAGIPWAIHSSCWPCRKRHRARFVWRVIRTIQALRRARPDVILAYCARPCISSGLAWRWSPAKAFIWSQRDCYLSNDAVVRFAYRRASAVICNAKHEVDFLRQTLGETSAPVFVVHNGIDLAPPKKSRAEWRAELGISDNATVATMVANFRFQKDHQTLLRAWRKVFETLPKERHQPQLLLAGAPQESFESVQQLARNLGLITSVHFLGQVQDISGLLVASDIGILTSPQEGLPNAVIEYMASGLPVVATDLPANRETLGDDPQQPFCNPGDPDSLAALLQVLLRDPDLRQKLGVRNQQRASAMFSIDAMCEKSVRIIGDLLESRPRAELKQ